MGDYRPRSRFRGVESVSTGTPSLSAVLCNLVDRFEPDTRVIQLSDW